MTISEERKKRLIDLYYNQGKITREIAHIERMSIRDIPTIFREEEESKRQRHKDQQQQEETSSKAHRLFSKGKKPVEVAIVLNLREPAAAKYYREYSKLKRLHILNPIFKETDGKSRDTLKFYKWVVKEKNEYRAKLDTIDIAAAGKLHHMESHQE